MYDGFRSNNVSLNTSVQKLLDNVVTSGYGYEEVDANVNRRVHEVKDMGEKIEYMLREIEEMDEEIEDSTSSKDEDSEEESIDGEEISSTSSSSIDGEEGAEEVKEQAYRMVHSGSLVACTFTGTAVAAARKRYATPMRNTTL